MGVHGEASRYVARKVVREDGAWGFLDLPISVMGNFLGFGGLPFLCSEAKEVGQAVLVAIQEVE